MLLAKPSSGKKGKHALPVGDCIAHVSDSQKNIEANLSTVFQSVPASKQYCYCEVMGTVQFKVRKSVGEPTLFLTLSCAQYESPEISNYLRQVNDVPDS